MAVLISSFLPGMGRHQWLDSSSWPFKRIIAKNRNWSLQQGKAYGQGPSLECYWHLVCEHTQGPRNEWGPLPRELNDNPWVHVSALLWEFCRDCLILCIWPNVFRYGVHLKSFGFFRSKSGWVTWAFNFLSSSPFYFFQFSWSSQYLLYL